MDYKEQIKSPKWQKRRLEILNRDNFTCQICGSTDRMLHVHHTYYEKGKKIWEYGDDQLITLCEDCHEYEHAIDDSISDLLWNIKRKGVLNHEILSLLQTVDIGLSMGNQNAIKDIAGDGFMPDIDREYIKLLAERRFIIRKDQENGKTNKTRS